MAEIIEKTAVPPALNDNDLAHIMEMFHEVLTPKLVRLHARMGTISCEFAGEQFRHWVIQFRSAGSGFEIEEIEYDEDAVGMDFDL
jgi:hypothetical protein